MDWFLYDNGIRHERVKHLMYIKVGRAFTTGAYLEPCQMSNMELFKKTVYSGIPLTIFAKMSSILTL